MGIGTGRTRSPRPFELERRAGQPLDPVVDTADIPDGTGGSTKAYLLRAAVFTACTNPSEVRECAIPLVRVLNGLMAAYRSSREVTFSTIVERSDDGGYRRHLYFKVQGGEYRMRASSARLLRQPEPPPQPSYVQKALTVASGDLAAALEHFSRANNWYDLDKALDAIAGTVPGGRQGLRTLGFTIQDIKDIDATANAKRHHKPRHTPSREWSLDEARDFVARVIRAYFDRLTTSSE